MLEVQEEPTETDHEIHANELPFDILLMFTHLSDERSKGPKRREISM
jgi:hypothetical protein